MALPMLLIHTIAVSLASNRLIHKIRDKNRQLDELSRTDSLSGLLVSTAGAGMLIGLLTVLACGCAEPQAEDSAAGQGAPVPDELERVIEAWNATLPPLERAMAAIPPPGTGWAAVSWLS